VTAPVNKLQHYFNSSVDDFDGAYHDVGRRYHLIQRYKIINEEFEHACGRPGDGPWLDAGCGAGVLACSLAARNFNVLGIDISPKMIERAVAKAKSAGVSERASFQVGNLESLPFATGSLAGVVSSGVIEYSSDPRIVLAEFARVLRPAAPFIVTLNNIMSPFRWLSGPAKKPLLLFTGSFQRSLMSRAYSLAQGKKLLADVGLITTGSRRHTFAFNVKTLWFPPLVVARRLEVLSQFPILRQLAWGLVITGRRAE
jgi:ubiquinone/menaquinone biosynthesis C-methylase UbiE